MKTINEQTHFKNIRSVKEIVYFRDYRYVIIFNSKTNKQKSWLRQMPLADKIQVRNCFGLWNSLRTAVEKPWWLLILKSKGHLKTSIVQNLLLIRSDRVLADQRSPLSLDAPCWPIMPMLIINSDTEYNSFHAFQPT